MRSTPPTSVAVSVFALVGGALVVAGAAGGSLAHAESTSASAPSRQATSRPVTSRPEPSTFRPDPTTSRPDPTTSRPESTTSRPEPSTFRPEPSTFRPDPTTFRPDPTTSRPVPTTSRPAPTTSRPAPPAPPVDDPNIIPLPSAGSCDPLVHQVVVAPFTTAQAGEEIVVDEPLMLAGCITDQIPSTPMVLMLEENRDGAWVKVADSAEWETPGRIDYLATEGTFRWTVRANTLWGGTGVVSHNH